MRCELPGFRIEPLGDHHLRGAFSCGLEAIDAFIQGRALKDHKKYKVRVQVAVLGDDPTVIGFYSLSLTTLTPQAIKGPIGSKFGKWPVPAVYLSMIGSETALQKKYIGVELMLHAFRATLHIADLAGTACLTLDAVDDEKALWYTDRSFKRIRPDELKMYIPLATVRDACEAADAAEIQPAG